MFPSWITAPSANKNIASIDDGGDDHYGNDV